MQQRIKSHNYNLLTKAIPPQINLSFLTEKKILLLSYQSLTSTNKYIYYNTSVLPEMYNVSITP